ncbi:MAG: DUF374 domain-containing protein [Chlorobiaceae bacterium]
MPTYEKGAIFAFWHGKMVAGWMLTHTLFPGKHATAVVSRSEDGRILSDTLKQLGFSLIRGSSSKGSDEVIRSMRQTLEKREIVVLTPDGPKGPMKQFKYGLLRLAASNHFTLIFADISYTNSWKLKSWDRFEIPKPFTKTSVSLKLINLPEFKNEEELRAYSKQLSDQFSHA